MLLYCINNRRWRPLTVLQASTEALDGSRAEAAILLLVVMVCILLGLFLLVAFGVAMRRRSRNIRRKDQLKESPEADQADPARDPWSASARRLDLPRRPRSNGGDS